MEGESPGNSRPAHWMHGALSGGSIAITPEAKPLEGAAGCSIRVITAGAPMAAHRAEHEDTGIPPTAAGPREGGGSGESSVTMRGRASG
ncbi:hypothetical protein EYF80_046509 [Liparis tanakae]|uniref:Uncharacterized protein n=1 Tax=Liparis tanakae TaxID=230148 RepID=A0A4Z2FQ59_9TELE|nr:hypothetical protein EYF80_046509 [Liparis tanakae]